MDKTGIVKNKSKILTGIKHYLPNTRRTVKSFLFDPFSLFHCYKHVTFQLYCI